MLFNGVFLLFLSTQALLGKTSTFKYKRDEPFNRLQDLELTMAKCIMDKSLYNNVKARILNTPLKGNYAEFKKNIIEEPGIKSNHGMYFLMVSNTDFGNARDVYKVSVRSNTMEKTGITLTKRVLSMVYDRKSNTLFWSDIYGIYKQEVELNTKMTRSSGQRGAYDLNIYKETLFYYSIFTGRRYIHTHNLTKTSNEDIWHSVEHKRISHLRIDGGIACWIERGIFFSINCVEMCSKKKIFTQWQRQPDELAFFKTSDFGMLLFAEKNGQNKYCIKVIEIDGGGGQFSKPKTVSHFEKKREIKVSSGVLLYSIFGSNKVEMWEIFKNGSVGMKMISTRYPSLRNPITAIVALI